MEISATEFKAKCLELLDRVNRSDEVITITKRGKVVAELRAPYGKRIRSSGPGFAKGEIEIVADLIEPTGENWDVL